MNNFPDVSAENPDSLDQLLADLVAIPSVNPAFEARSPNDFGELRAAEFLAGIARKSGLSVDFQAIDALPGRSNLIVRLPAKSAPTHTILLAPHLDTVSIKEDFQVTPVIQNGRLHGRGACDTKGSVAAMFQALLDVANRTGGLPSTEIVFAGLADEENKQRGSRHLAKSLPPADLAIIGEPTECQCVTAHKGNFWQRITVHGKAAHGAQPQHGVNAIVKMSRLIEALETQYQPLLKSKSHPLLGNPTLNIGKIIGGTQNNIVPDSCSIEVDRRTIPGESLASFHQEIQKIADQTGIEIHWDDSKGVDCPPMETQTSIPMVQKFMQFSETQNPIGVDYFCDAAVIRQNGTPCLVFGPGNIAQAHTRDEWIDLASLHKAHNILSRFLLSFA